jgi:hypothetical protein
MRIEYRAEVLGKTHRTEACCFRCARAGPTQPRLDGPQRNPRDPIEQRRVGVPGPDNALNGITNPTVDNLTLVPWATP